MSAQRASPSAVSIGRVKVNGVAAATARAIGPAIETALASVAEQGRIAAGHRDRLKIDLSYGASEREIAAAVARALARK